jgi:hypothetical protein
MARDWQDLLERAYAVRCLLAAACGDQAWAGIEAGRIVIWASQPLEPGLEQQLQQLAPGLIELRTRPIACHSLAGDHCNGDYDRS